MRAEFYNLYLRQRNCYPKRAWQLGSAKTVHCYNNTSMYLRSVWETWWLLKAKNIRSLNARYNIWKANYFCRSMGNATKIWVLLSSIAKTLHVLTTVPCNANASDSIIPNDLRIWSNNFSFPHLFWESKLRTQDWTLAITQGGQEPHSFDVLHLLRIQFFVEDICKRVPAVTSALGKLK